MCDNPFDAIKAVATGGLAGGGVRGALDPLRLTGGPGFGGDPHGILDPMGFFGGDPQAAGAGGAPGMPSPAPPPPAPLSEQADKTQFQVPGASSIPQGVGLRGDMNPLQQRSLIAQRGTQGGSIGAYWRSQPGMDLYRNIALRSLVDPASGSVIPGANILPIERQYLSDVFGRQLKRDTPEHFLTLLTG